MKPLKYTLIFSLVLLMSSCEKIFFEKDLASTDPYVNFDYLWKEVDKKYAYFDIKQVNWDQIRINYRSKLYANMSQDSLFRVLSNMLNELKDDHTNLISPFNISSYDVYLKGPDNYEWRTVREYYLKDDVHNTQGIIHAFIANKTIGYIRYDSFMIDPTDDALDYILNRYANTKGLILDLRENGGGALEYVNLILSRFISSQTLVAYNRTRNGPGKNDFGKDEPFYIKPSDRVKYLKPVMVLIDRGSYSATTFFSLATKALNNLVLVGDTTGGGGGLPNGGQLPNGWTYRFSISQVLDLNKNNYAEKGVPPDIHANFNWNDLTKDEIIETAIQQLK